MSKIETFKKAKNVAETIARAVKLSLGRDDPRNDKASFTVRFDGLENADWTRMKFAIGMSYGYYGSSSAYSVTSDDMGRYLAKSLAHHKVALLETAAAMANEDAEKARRDAEAEAKQVLGEVA